MIAQNRKNGERPDPIQERVGEGIFTDREEEMASLMEWVGWVGQKFGRSRGLVSHRRYGKTAIMERLYNRIFWERDDVKPFYFELHEGIRKISLRQLADLYLRTFLQQFLAYRTRDASFAFSSKVSFESLYELAERIGETSVTETIDFWLKENRTDILLKASLVLHNIPHDFAVETGLSIIVMFDEFQRLDQVVYYDDDLTRLCENYTDSFSSSVESSRAPMLIAGSQVTMLMEQALWHGMAGRVGVEFIQRLPSAGSVELALKFAKRHQLELSLDLAYTIHYLVDGHPYYIWCLFHSRYIERNLTTEEGIQNTLTYEVENRQGYISQFWQHHFGQNMEAFNLPYARKIILYLTEYPNDRVHIEQLTEDLELPISLEETTEILRRLIWTDFIDRGRGGFYSGLSDLMLARVLRVEYGWEIEQLMREDAVAQIKAEFVAETADAKDKIIQKLRGELSSWTGRFAEMFIDKLMKRHFNDQHIDGSHYFNQPGEIQLSHFDRLFTTMAQPAGATTSYQIDLYGVPAKEGALPWIVEVKNWQNPVNKPDVEHFWEAAQNLAQDRGHDKMRCWFYARSGFSGPAKDFLDEKGILYTDQAQLERLLTDLQVIEDWRAETQSSLQQSDELVEDGGERDDCTKS